MDITYDGPTVILRGDFDVRSTMEVRAALHAQLESWPDDVVVDLAGVDTVDVTALRVLGVASLTAVRSGQHLTVRGCSPAVRRMLHLTRMIRVLEVEREHQTA